MTDDPDTEKPTDPDAESANDRPWRDTVGLSDTTTKARIYPKKHHKQQWQQEADEQGKSLSQYIIDRVHEARAADQLSTTVDTAGDTDRVAELEDQVAALQTELEAERRKNAGRREIDDLDLLTQFLDTDEARSLSEVLQPLLESEAAADLIGSRVENQLYVLAQKGAVEYVRGPNTGTGWKLADDTDEG